MRNRTNTEMLHEVVTALDALSQQVIFVGGAVVELYATDEGAAPVRPTFDVDCLVRVTSRLGYHRIENQLGQQGFTHDASVGSPVCRMRCGDIAVDLIPPVPEVLGFANTWHQRGLQHIFPHTLDSGLSLLLLSPPFFHASKVEALLNRGGDDWRGAPDFEDIVFLLHSRLQLPQETVTSPQDVRKYLGRQFAQMLVNSTIHEDIASALRPSEVSRRRLVFEQMQKLASQYT